MNTTDNSYDPKKIDNYEYGEQSSKFRSFLWYCAGADVKILEQCPQSERIKEEGIGGIVLATGGLAFVSGSYAFYTVFTSGLGEEGKQFNTFASVASIIFGYMWAFVIFNLDRFIVSSVSHGDGTSKIAWSELKSAIPRLIMALIIGLCLAAPLEIRVMQSEIEIQLDEDRDKEGDKYKPGVERRFSEAKELNEKRQSEVNDKFKKLRDDIDAKEKNIQEQIKIMNDEAAGKRGTVSNSGIGIKYREAEILKNDFVAQKAELQRREDEQKPQLAKEKLALEAERDEITRVRNNELQEIKKKTEKLDGLVKRVQIAHTHYPVQSGLLSLLLIIIEIAPIFFKMMLQTGPYDLLVENQRRLTQARYAIEKHSAVHSDPDNQHHVGETFHQAEMLGSYEIGSLAVQKELAKKIQDTYLQKTKEDIDKNPDKYLA